MALHLVSALCLALSAQAPELAVEDEPTPVMVTEQDAYAEQGSAVVAGTESGTRREVKTRGGRGGSILARIVGGVVLVGGVMFGLAGALSLAGAMVARDPETRDVIPNNVYAALPVVTILTVVAAVGLVLGLFMTVAGGRSLIWG